MSFPELPPDAPAPRLCHLVKWPDFDGYGFNLHAEKSRAGQFIGKIDVGSPAEFAGMKEGDRIIEVNGVNIANENHKQVVERIKAVPHETRLLVLDEEADKWYKERKIVVRNTQSNVLYCKTPSKQPLKGSDELATDINGENHNGTDHVSEEENDSGHVGNESPVLILHCINRFVNDNSRKLLALSNLALKPKEKLVFHLIKDHHRDLGIGSLILHVLESFKVKVKVFQNKISPASTPKSQDSGSRQRSVDSASDSPQSTRSAQSQNDQPESKMKTSSEDLNLNMSASEMRQLLSARRKRDPRKEQMDMREKYHIIQQM
ncbi:Na(+)/H(+) exchange regulatory cofactor NHE-RF1-like [Limulus polyphemus]|uniref:Na(+)/H(+) exchange regulatory cofactor NHE-RF1-like n=1 Tax=Limulus polyphemus TaxID=6850 RepID=A0ABM1T567_LIMPO|nr:Na(+)/H(+) exchange regulatory cofactor NHE-RF1-like [Limulus polyphemus]